MTTKTYTVDIHSYPQEFIVTASSKEEAIEKAKELFHLKNGPVSIYESEITDEEEVEG